MIQNWNKSDAPNGPEGQPIPQKLKLFPERYRQKSFAPSQQAIDNYNSISTTVGPHNYDNMSFIPENGDVYGSNFSTMSSTKPLNGINSHNGIENFSPHSPISGHIFTHDDYATIGSSSGATKSIVGSETDMERKEELGSTAKLVRPRLRDSCNTCLGYVETVLCTISLACGLGNIYRLPLAVLGGGGLPFLIAYIILAILIGLPLLILEIGLGQIVQEGFMKTWRAVPFFRGVGYVKLLAGCLLSLYYPLYIGLSVFYLIWFTKGKPPFSECAFVTMQETGYKADGISGQECLKKTFLESPFTDPYWFGILAAILFGVWAVIMAGVFKRTRIYVMMLIIYLLFTLGCLIALLAKALEAEKYQGLEKLTGDIDWNLLGTSNVWYFAAIQVFFATNVGFGIFVTNAGIIFKKVNPVWTASCFTFVHLLVGLVAVMLSYMFSVNVQHIPASGDVLQAHVLTLIYDISLTVEESKNLAWPVIAYFLIVFSGFISMTAIMYTVLKAISLETRRRWYWWQLTIFLGVFGFLLSAAILLVEYLQIAHMFDHYVVGNLILLTVIIEVFAFVCFYGHQRMQSDFEFVLGHKVSRLWMWLWWLCPIILLGVFIWALSTLPLNGYLDVDPIWLYATGWSIVLLSLIFIVALGISHVSKQDEYYTFADKMKAALKYSRKWGPVDPIMRYNWVQWHSKAKNGQRDFTLRRRGTKEYTHSVKNRSKYSTKRFAPEDSTTNTGSIAYRKNDQNQNNITLTNITTYDEPYYATPEIRPPQLPVFDRQLRVTSLVDTLDPPAAHSYVNRSTYVGDNHKLNLNPLANVNYSNDVQNDGAASEGYGTFRKGPFVIDSGDAEHVCYRRNSDYSEEATEL